MSLTKKVYTAPIMSIMNVMKKTSFWEWNNMLERYL